MINLEVQQQDSSRAAHHSTSSMLLEQLLTRRSVHPRWLVEPGPDDNAIRNLVRAAVTAIDHGGLRPWKFISITGDARNTLAETFVKIKKARQADISCDDLQRERDRALKAPVMIAVVSKIRPDHHAVPLHEQHASIGAAIQNMLLCAHLLGFGAKMVSGRKVADPLLAITLGLEEGEALFGFICIGTATAGTNHKVRPSVDDVLTACRPDTSARSKSNVGSAELITEHG